MNSAYGFTASVESWAQAQWGTVELGDERLRKRAVALGTAVAQRPAASLPQQAGSRAALKGAYALLKNPKVTHERLQQPHWQATRQAMAAAPVVLLPMDTTELDYTRYAAHLSGLGPIGDGRGAGLLLHSMLAVLPERRVVLGLAHQQLIKRKPIPPGTSRRQRPKAERESRLGPQAVAAMGTPPAGVRWVVIGDRGADATDFLALCAGRMDFLVRMSYEHRLAGEGEARYLLRTVRGWPAQGAHTLELPARPGRAARTAQLRLSFGSVTIRTSTRKGAPGLRLWVVRVWEVDAPPGAEPLEWVLATTLPVQTLAQAREKVEWYTTRWFCEDYHQCLKTGCAVERRDLEAADRIRRLVGFLALSAVRLLQLRQAARQTPERGAAEILPAPVVALMAARLQQDPSRLRLGEFWRGVATLGGFLGRARDGEPGWKVLWRGWLELEAYLRGIDLALQAKLLHPLPSTYG